MKEKLTETEIDMVEGEKPLDIKQFKNGNDIHFDYQEDQYGRQMNTKDPQRKKKKKKGKNKQKGAKNVEAIINDPDAEYPTSRVIKQADNGEVIVESLDEQSPRKAVGNPMSCLPNSVRAEEEENINKFWRVLTDEQRTELVRIDKEHMLQMFRNGIRNPHATSSSDKLDHVSHNVDKKTTPKGAGLENHNNVNGLNALCKCTNCGRKNKYIEEIVGNIYDEHYEDIMDFVKGMNKIDDLNAIPGLLFDGYHMLEEEYNLQKRQKDRIRLSNHSSYASESNGSLKNKLDNSEAFRRNNFPHNEGREANREDFQRLIIGNDDEERIKSGIESAVIDDAHIRHPEGEFEELEETLRMNNSRVPSPSSVEELHNKMIFESQSDEHGLQNMFQKIFDPNLMEELKNRRNEISDQDSFNRYIEDMKKKTDRVKDLKNGTKLELEKSVEILKNMGRLFSGELNSGTLSQGFSSFAEDLLKNDGKSFIDIMENLSGSGGSKNKMPSTNDDAGALPFENRVDDVQQDTGKVETLKDSCSSELRDLVENKESVIDGEGNDVDGLGEASASIEDVVDEEYKDEGDLASESEPEFNDKWIMQEIRRLFLMYVLQVFQERMKVAYKEKLCQERAQKFIEELEAEENAKKERELKKSKQKEKAKEKKRLQQQMKEEERHRKAEEQRQREEQLIWKQEAIKEEQRRQREEARQKKEEEKRKKIDELKRKEYELQKREEELQKKEEEKKKRIEEAKRKEEENKIRNHELKRKEEQQRKINQQRKKEEELKRIESKKHTDDVHQSQTTKEFDDGKSRFLDNNAIANSYEIGSINLGVHVGRNANSPISLNRGSNLDTLLSNPEKNKEEMQLLETELSKSRLDEFGFSSGISKVAPPYKDFYAQDRNEDIALADQPYLPVKYNIDQGNSTNVYSGNVHRGGLPTASENAFPSVFSPTAPNILPTNNSFKDQHVNKLPPWSIENQAVNQQQSFQPFGTFAGDSLPQHTNENLTPNFTNNLPYPDPFGTNGIHSSMWNVGVGKKSIWDSSKVGPGIWSNTVGSPMGSSQKNVELLSLNEQNLIRTAAYCAFQLLRDANQLELGFAATTKLYETTKQVLANPNLTLSQMLSHCRNQGALSKYCFEYVYDEIGTVTHIKADLTNPSSQVQYNTRFSQPSQTAESNFPPMGNPVSYHGSPFNQNRSLAGNGSFGMGSSDEFFNFDHLSNSVHNLWS